MSTAYGVKCLSCNENSYDWITNDRLNNVQKIVREWPKIKQLLDIAEELEALFTWTFNIEASVQSANLFGTVKSFLSVHYGHDLVEEDEYGHTQPIEGYIPTVEPIGTLEKDLNTGEIIFRLPKNKIGVLFGDLNET